MPELPEDVIHLICAQIISTPRHRLLPATPREVLSWKIDRAHGSLHDLQSIALVNRAWNRAANWSLYNTLQIRPRWVPNIDRLLEGFVRDPERASHVRALRIRSTPTWSSKLSRQACHLAVIDAAKDLPIDGGIRRQLIEDLKLGRADAKIVLLLCLCPKTEALQFRDGGCEADSLMLDVIASARKFSKPRDLPFSSINLPGEANDCHSRAQLTNLDFLTHLRIVRVYWKNSKADECAGTIIAGNGDAHLAMPVEGLHPSVDCLFSPMRRVLQDFPFLNALALYSGRRPWGREGWPWHASEKWFTNSNVLTESGPQSTSDQTREHDRILEQRLSWTHLLRTSSLQALEIDRRALFARGGRTTLQQKLPKSIQALWINHQCATRGNTGMDFLRVHIQDHDLQLVQLILDPEFAELCQVCLVPNGDYPYKFESTSRLQLFQTALMGTSWEITAGSDWMLFKKRRQDRLANENEDRSGSWPCEPGYILADKGSSNFGPNF
jgi:hypothetical protein